MKRIVCTLLCFAFCSCGYSQTGSAYKQYLKNLCSCFQKNTTPINSMNDASGVTGKCMNLIDTGLRNKAMREKKIMKADDAGLIHFERLFAMDLLNECSGFKATMEKLSAQTQNKAVAKLPILDTIAVNACRCLESKGVSNVKSVVVNNITECLNSSIVKNFDEIIRQYKINDDNQEILSALGEQVSKMVMENCKFYVDKLNPVLIKK